MADDEDIEQKDPSLSYRYWVNKRGDGTEAPAPAAIPKPLSQEELKALNRVESKGSAWNQGGTWEEKTLNDWAKARLRDLLRCSSSATVGGSKYSLICEMESCTGDTTIVVVRNRKRFGYLLTLEMKMTGKCDAEKDKDLSAKIRIHDASFGDIDDWEPEYEVDRAAGKLSDAEVAEVEKSARLLLPRLQQQMLLFEEELKKR